MSDDLFALRRDAVKAHKAGELDTAQQLYGDYLARRPDDPGVWSNLGALHRANRQHQMALRAHQRAIALSPDDLGLLNNMANILSDLGEYDASIEIRQRIMAQSDAPADQLAMYGRCLRGKGDYGGAIKHLNQAILQAPDEVELRMQRALAKLADGQYREGFDEYRVRWQAGELTKRNLTLPQWDGRPLDGLRLLVLPEQGLGDVVLSMRFLPVLRETGGPVRVVVPKPLMRLFSGIDGVTFKTADSPGAMDADYWTNVMDLAVPHFASNNNVPAPVRLTIPDDATARAKVMVAPYDEAFKVGVVWSGSATYKGNAFRSFSHRDFLPLTDVPGVQLFSLYKGPYLEPYLADGSAAFIVDAASEDRDLADCAATMSQMDLIITTDTATAHIAGSLGLPVWTLLHWDPFWLWSHDGDTTPWYPSMRLFRQSKPLDWSAVLATVTKSLGDAAKGAT